MHRTPLRLAVAATAVAATFGLTAGTAFADSSTSTTTPGGASGGHHAKTGHHTKGGAPGQSRTAPLAADASLTQIQQAAATDIKNRVDDLNTALGRIAKAKNLGNDQAALTKKLQADITGLQQVGTKVAGDTDAKTAMADYMTIFTNYRVYLVTLPVARLVTADDRVGTAGTRLTTASSKIAAKETPANQAQVQPLLADLANQVKAASGAVNGQQAALLGDTASAWNANHKLLDDNRKTTKTATGDLKKARSDAQQAAKAAGVKVKGGKGGHSRRDGRTATTSTGTSAA